MQTQFQNECYFEHCAPDNDQFRFVHISNSKALFFSIVLPNILSWKVFMAIYGTCIICRADLAKSCQSLVTLIWPQMFSFCWSLYEWRAKNISCKTDLLLIDHGQFPGAWVMHRWYLNRAMWIQGGDWKVLGDTVRASKVDWCLNYRLPTSIKSRSA